MTDGSSSSASGAFFLIVENAPAGDSPGRAAAPPSRFELTARETIVGRDPSCAIRIDDLFVSRRHARLLLRGSDLHLDDLGSTNVTRRNGDPVRTRVRLHPGDVLQFASVRARLVEARPGSQAEPPTSPGPGGADAGEGDTEAEAAPAPSRPADPETEAPAPAGGASPAAAAATPADRRGDAGTVAGPVREESSLPAGAPPGTAAPGDGVVGEDGAGRRTPDHRAESFSHESEVVPGLLPAEVFVAGPLPGEARRARVRAALWFAGFVALAALGAALFR